MAYPIVAPMPLIVCTARKISPTAAGAARRGGVTLELEQRVIDGGDVLAALGEKELGVLERVHSGVAGARAQPNTR